MTFDCGGIELTYKGGESGELSILAPYGAFFILATKHENTSNAGSAVKVTTIRGAGLATLRMTARADLEACITGKLSLQGLTTDSADDNMKFYHANLCHQSLPLAADPVAAEATAEITLIGEPPAQAFIERNYEGAPDYLKAPTFPVLQCTVLQGR